MRRYRVGCLPVVTDGRLLGVVTEEDFVSVAGQLLGETPEG
jgi:CBS domain-containing protein